MKVVRCYNVYLPKTCTLAIHERLVFPLNRFKLLVFFITPMRLHHKPQESVVRSVSWSKINTSGDFFFFLLFLPKFLSKIEKEKGWHTKHGVELQWNQVQAAIWTGQVAIFGPRNMIKVWFSAERVQNPYFTPEGGGGEESVFLGSQCAIQYKMVFTLTEQFWNNTRSTIMKLTGICSICLVAPSAFVEGRECLCRSGLVPAWA